MNCVRRLFLCLAAFGLALFVTAANAADCTRASAAFEASTREAKMYLDAVSAHRVDWSTLQIVSAEERAAYSRVNEALQALLPAVRQHLDLSSDALGLMGLCALGDTIDDARIAKMEAATNTAGVMIVLARTYLQAFEALPASKAPSN